MLLHWPHSEPVGGLELEVIRPIEARGKTFEVGPVVYAPGDLVPIEVLGTDPVRIRGLEITNHIRVGLDLVPDGASAKKGRSPRKG